MTNRVTVQPTPVTVGSTTWPVLFTFQGWYPLFQHYGGLQEALESLATGAQDAAVRFFWAGLLHSMPDLQPEEATAILDDGSMPELAALPARLADAVRASMPDRNELDADGDGEPWDWKMARAVWSTEWGQDPDRFWDQTFREFDDLSSGRAKLYARAKDGASDGGTSHSGGQWSGTLEELLMLGRRR